MIPNFVVQSGDLNWKGYATTEAMAFKKAFSSFKKGELSILVRFYRAGYPWMYISIEAALDQAGIKFKDYVA